MINYQPKHWWAAISHFNSSYVIRRTLRMVLGIGLYAAVLAACDYLFRTHPDMVPLNLRVKIEPLIFSLLGVFLSLLLVFRLNSAYDRWWEGRKQWGALINHTRGLAVLIHGMLGAKGEGHRRFFALGISGYVLGLSDHLRDQTEPAWIAHYAGQAPPGIAHVPNRIVRDLYQRCETLYADGFIDGFQLTLLKPETQSFLDIQGACERIKATPIPFAHNFFIKLFVVAYCVLVPFVLIPAVGFYAIPMVMFVAYALIGLEFISVEIEEPFGLDCNDLPTHSLARKIEKNVHEILEVPLEKGESQPAQDYVVIN